MDKIRAIVDYADEDEAKEMRDVLYSELQDRVMAHIEAHKQVVAANMFNRNEEPEESEVQVEPEEQNPETQNT